MLTGRQRTPVPLALPALLALCLALLTPFPSRAADRSRGHVSDQASSRDPVVFVHGYNADPGVRGGLREDLRAAGYTDSELFSWGYGTRRSVNEVLAGGSARTSKRSGGRPAPPGSTSSRTPSARW